MLFSNGSPQVYRSPMGHVGLRWSMSVSEESPIRHVSLPWYMSVFHGACQFDEACRGLRSGMSVSDMSPIIIIFS